MTVPGTLEAERARLAEAERQQRVLSDVSRVLLDYVGPDEVEPLRRIVEKVTEAMGDWCAFALVQPDGRLVNVATYHPDPRQRELEKKLNALMPPQQWNAGPPEFNALVQRQPVVVEDISDELLRTHLPSKEVYDLYKEVGMTSVITAPMFDGPSPLGVLTLVSTGERRRYTKTDIDFAFSLAGRAGLAVRNARLVRQIAEERDRQSRALQDLERRAAELTAVFDSDPNGLALFDANGILRMASARLEEIFGLPLSTMVGQRFDQIYAKKLVQHVDPNKEQLLDRVRQIFSDREHRTEDEVELEKPRHRWLIRQTAPVNTADGTYLGRIVVYTDITDRRELDRQRQDFLTVAAHELRTPLTPLSMYLQTIERRLDRGQPVDPQLAIKARRQVGRLGKLVEDLLDVTRLESRRLQLVHDEFDLNDLAEDVIGDFRSEARIHEMVLQRSHLPVVVRGDRARLEQVLVNLLGNAIKYSPAGGRITVRVQTRGSLASVSVTDPGIGIPHAEHGRLFQRFFRAANATTRNYSGLGIGLYVSDEIVRRHGGHFEVTSEEGEGSTFTFYLPLATRAQAHGDRARVLLVDDDPAILEATGQILREWGYTVDEAADGFTALGLMRAAKPDLLLIDLMMPAMDGGTLIHRIREEKVAEGVPIVVFSADKEARKRAGALQADAMLHKPFELQELQDVVERLLPQKPAA